MTRSLKVSAVQAGSILFDTPDTMVRFETLLARAAKDQPDLVVFPEAFIGGYPKGCLLYTSPSPRDQRGSRMPSSA